MACHKRAYTGERYTVKRTLQLTPSQAAQLDAWAKEQGATWSDIGRELMFRRLAMAATVAGVRRDPEAAAIMRDMLTAANQNSGCGNLMNQIARHANMTGEVRDGDWELLREALALNKRATELHILALERLLSR